MAFILCHNVAVLVWKSVLELQILHVLIARLEKMQIKHSLIALNDVDWRAIRSEIDCYTFSVWNSTDVVLKIRTLDTDPNTEIPVQPMNEYVFSDGTAKNSRILANQLLAYGQLASGSANISRISKD